ncbi:hypothetical protein SLS54_010165 [Diplodia seriata]
MLDSTMKLNIRIMYAMTIFTPVFSAAISDAAAECGSLGVMSLDNLPEGVDPADVRKCADHPLGSDPSMGESSVAPVVDESDGIAADANNDTSPNLQARACWFGAARYGCTDGYCWKTCGSGGKWCWTAKKGGIGEWYTCGNYRDCKEKWACGKGRDCDSCGCSC